MSCWFLGNLLASFGSEPRYSPTTGHDGDSFIPLNKGLSPAPGLPSHSLVWVGLFRGSPKTNFGFPLGFPLKPQTQEIAPTPKRRGTATSRAEDPGLQGGERQRHDRRGGARDLEKRTRGSHGLDGVRGEAKVFVAKLL